MTSVADFKQQEIAEPPCGKFQFRISSCQSRLYNNIDFYLSNNIYQSYIKDNKQADPDFKLVEWITDDSYTVDTQL